MTFVLLASFTLAAAAWLQLRPPARQPVRIPVRPPQTRR